MKKMVALLVLCLLSFNIFCVFVCAEQNISAKAAIVLVADTKEVLFDKSANLRLPMASTTKIMTALLLAEQPELSKTVRVTKEMITVEGSSMGLSEGDVVSYRDLLYGMLLSSGNDAANATAYALGGGIKGFAIMMNNKAKEIGLKNTSFVTPSGLDDENHYTTAYDMAVLTAEALKNTAFRVACSSKSAVIYFGSPKVKRVLTNHNKLLSDYDGMIGVKTGFTKKSGRCLVTAAERDGKRIVAVTLNAPDDWNDHKKLLDYGFENTTVFNNVNLCNQDVLPLISGQADLVRLVYEKKQISVSQKNADNISHKIILSKFVYTPVGTGETVGRIEYYLNNKRITTSDIYSAADVECYNRKEKLSKRFLKNIKALWSSS